MMPQLKKLELGLEDDPRVNTCRFYPHLPDLTPRTGPRTKSLGVGIDLCGPMMRALLQGVKRGPEAQSIEHKIY